MENAELDVVLKSLQSGAAKVPEGLLQANNIVDKCMILKTAYPAYVTLETRIRNLTMRSEKLEAKGRTEIARKLRDAASAVNNQLNVFRNSIELIGKQTQEAPFSTELLKKERKDHERDRIKQHTLHQQSDSDSSMCNRQKNQSTVNNAETKTQNEQSLMNSAVTTPLMNDSIIKKIPTSNTQHQQQLTNPKHGSTNTEFFMNITTTGNQKVSRKQAFTQTKITKFVRGHQLEANKSETSAPIRADDKDDSTTETVKLTSTRSDRLRRRESVCFTGLIPSTTAISSRLVNPSSFLSTPGKQQYQKLQCQQQKELELSSGQSNLPSEMFSPDRHKVKIPSYPTKVTQASVNKSPFSHYMQGSINTMQTFDAITNARNTVRGNIGTKQQEVNDGTHNTLSMTSINKLLLENVHVTQSKLDMTLIGKNYAHAALLEHELVVYASINQQFFKELHHMHGNGDTYSQNVQRSVYGNKITAASETENSADMINLQQKYIDAKQQVATMRTEHENELIDLTKQLEHEQRRCVNMEMELSKCRAEIKCLKTKIVIEDLQDISCGKHSGLSNSNSKKNDVCGSNATCSEVQGTSFSSLTCENSNLSLGEYGCSTPSIATVQNDRENLCQVTCDSNAGAVDMKHDSEKNTPAPCLNTNRMNHSSEGTLCILKQSPQIKMTKLDKKAAKKAAREAEKATKLAKEAAKRAAKEAAKRVARQAAKATKLAKEAAKRAKQNAKTQKIAKEQAKREAKKRAKKEREASKTKTSKDRKIKDPFKKNIFVKPHKSKHSMQAIRDGEMYSSLSYSEIENLPINKCNLENEVRSNSIPSTFASLQNSVKLKACQYCDRKFNPDSLVRHEKVCQSSKSKPIKKFNARQKRMKALAQMNGLSRTGIRKIADKVRYAEAKIQKSAGTENMVPKWKMQSTALRDAMRAAREYKKEKSVK